MDKHQFTGRAKEAEGKIKEEVGKVFGNRNLQGKGSVQKNLGKAEAKYGDLKSDLKNDAREDDDIDSDDDTVIRKEH